MAQPVEQPVITCYRHPNRRAGVSCQRCDRPICPDCMVQASVGFHCPECTKQAAKDSPVVTLRSLDVQPIVTQVLIGLNVLAFAATLAMGGTIGDGGGSLTRDLALVGAGRFVNRGPIVGVASGEWYRLISGGFMHAGIIHIGMNMLVLWLVGAQLERVLGHARYLSLYVASLMAGSFAVMLASPGDLTVGASGAIFGLFGAMFAFQRDRGINPMQSGLGGLIILNLVITFAIPGIAIAGHIGGLVGGFATGWLMFQLERRTRQVWPGVALCLGLAVLFAVGGIWGANYYLAHYPNAVLQF
jgi:membrane associated rhomboid family serine protease